MRIQFTAGYQEFKPGQFADVPPEMARNLIEAGKAKEAQIREVAKPAVKTDSKPITGKKK